MPPWWPAATSARRSPLSRAARKRHHVAQRPHAGACLPASHPRHRAGTPSAMHDFDVALIAAFVLGFGLVSKALGRTPLTAPILAVAFDPRPWAASTRSTSASSTTSRSSCSTSSPSRCCSSTTRPASTSGSCGGIPRRARAAPDPRARGDDRARLRDRAPDARGASRHSRSRCSRPSSRRLTPPSVSTSPRSRCRSGCASAQRRERTERRDRGPRRRDHHGLRGRRRCGDGGGRRLDRARGAVGGFLAWASARPPGSSPRSSSTPGSARAGWRWAPSAARYRGGLVAAFFTAEALEGSGFLAAFVAGLVLGGGAIRALPRKAFHFNEEAGELIGLVTWIAFGVAAVPYATHCFDAATIVYAALSLTQIHPPARARAGGSRDCASIRSSSWAGSARGASRRSFAITVSRGRHRLGRGSSAWRRDGAAVRAPKVHRRARRADWVSCADRPGGERGSRTERPPKIPP